MSCPRTRWILGFKRLRRPCPPENVDSPATSFEGDRPMDDVNSVDELGPVDWIVVEFPGSRFNGEIAPALRDLVDREVVRVLDLLVLKKDGDGALEAFELSDLDTSEVGELRGYESELAMLLSEEDVT